MIGQRPFFFLKIWGEMCLLITRFHLKKKVINFILKIFKDKEMNIIEERISFRTIKCDYESHKVSSKFK